MPERGPYRRTRDDLAALVAMYAGAQGVGRFQLGSKILHRDPVTVGNIGQYVIRGRGDALAGHPSPPARA